MGLATRNLGRSFGPVVALEDVSLDFAPGSIHAVIGENGAGKSTLMNLLGGHLSPSAGDVLLDGEPVQFRSPQGAQAAGIEMVHQHFKLVANFSVAENLALNAAPRSSGYPGAVSLAQPALDRAAALGWHFDPDARVGSLSVGEQQRLEIAKCLVESCRVLILDEPTAVLSPGQVEDLFQVLRGLRDRGVTVLLIAHKLQEILSVADHISVLRHGKFVLSEPRAATSETQLAEAMLGSARESTKNDEVAEASSGGAPEPRAGEILGIGGVDGNGQREFAQAFLAKHPQAAFIPQDRQQEGLALTMSVQENLMLGPIGKGLWRTWLPAGKVQDWAKSLIGEYRIKTPSPRTMAGSLSGGNQQKIVLARALNGQPDVVVAMNPTRGLDFNSTEFVHQQLRAAARAGAAVLLVSSDRDELLQVADRVLYMVRGELKSSFEEAVQ